MITVLPHIIPPAPMTQEAAATRHHPPLPHHLVTDEQKVAHLIKQVEVQQRALNSAHDYINYLQRSYATVQSEALTAQLEVNQTLTEQILYLEEQLDAAKQRNGR